MHFGCVELFEQHGSTRRARHVKRSSQWILAVSSLSNSTARHAGHHALDTSNVSSQDVTWRDEPSEIWVIHQLTSPTFRFKVSSLSAINRRSSGGTCRVIIWSKSSCVINACKIFCPLYLLTQTSTLAHDHLVARPQLHLICIYVI